MPAPQARPRNSIRPRGGSKAANDGNGNNGDNNFYRKEREGREERISDERHITYKLSVGIHRRSSAFIGDSLRCLCCSDVWHVAGLFCRCASAIVQSRFQRAAPVTLMFE